MDLIKLGCKVTRTGLVIDGKLTEKRWQNIGTAISEVNHSLMWIVGDWLLAGESEGYLPHGKLDDAADKFGIEKVTAKDAKYVCGSFERSVRTDDLTFTHHKVVAGRADAPELLQWAVKTKATVKELREEKKRRTRLISGTPAMPVDRFNLILCDPPWKYDFAETDNRKIENQYPTMELEDICALEPPAASNCLLLMWATAPKMREAFELLDAWGFEYKTHGMWDKQIIGMGYWFRGQHEPLLVATKGDMQPPAQQHRVSSVFSEKRGKHSAKPDCVFEWIEKAFPKHKKCEMFCRVPRKGWSSWGNEL